jgi:hypothetical protein
MVTIDMDVNHAARMLSILAQLYSRRVSEALEKAENDDLTDAECIDLGIIKQMMKLLAAQLAMEEESHV